MRNQEIAHYQQPDPFFSLEWGLGMILSYPILPPPPSLPPSINPQSGETALHVSARYGHPEVLAFLCHSGATLNIQDKVMTNDVVLYNSRAPL